MTRAIDVSNYTGALSQPILRAWKDHYDVRLVIIQSINPPAGYPTGVTRQQLEACAQAGIASDVYLYLWTGSNVEADMRNKLALLNGLEHLVRKVWLDVEDDSHSTPLIRSNAVRQALAVIDGWCAAHSKPRGAIYTARWYWPSYMENTTEFSDRQLWDADYDGLEDTEASWIPYGGWRERRIKQYAGTSALAGQGGIDMNVLSTAEAAELAMTPSPMADPTPAEFRQALSYLRHDVIGPLSTYKYPRVKAAIAEVERVAEQYGAA